MADVSWPETLPQYFLLSGYTETLPDNMIASKIDVGRQKRRKRYTVANTTITGNIALTATQKATLETFYNVTLGGGVLAFDWVNPVTQVAYEFQFKANTPPKITPNGPVSFIAAIELEQLP